MKKREKYFFGVYSILSGRTRRPSRRRKEDAMAFDRQFLDELIARNDIVDVVSNYVSLTKKGDGYLVFHS